MLALLTSFLFPWLNFSIELHKFLQLNPKCNIHTKPSSHVRRRVDFTTNLLHTGLCGSSSAVSCK